MALPRRVWFARALALVADLVQIVALPLFGVGLASPINDLLDLAVGATMIALVGWHVAFLPAFVVEIFPIADLFPTWTAAALFVTRGRGRGRGGAVP